MFLTGVFVDDSAGFGTAPATLNYNSGPFTFDPIFAPELNQAFFIGDGLTGFGTGATQIFQAPEFADRLFLGFVDGNGFSGAPNFFNDNTGGLNFTGEISDVSAVPLPAGLVLLLTALTGLMLLRQRRAQTTVPV